MGSILLPAIGIAVATALLGSLVFSSMSNNESPFMALEEKCEKIALEGYKFHLKYPDLTPDKMPLDDMKILESLDKMWIDDCVNRLPAATIFDIIQRVELNYRLGD